MLEVLLCLAGGCCCVAVAAMLRTIAWLYELRALLATSPWLLPGESFGSRYAYASSSAPPEREGWGGCGERESGQSESNTGAVAAQERQQQHSSTAASLCTGAADSPLFHSDIPPILLSISVDTNRVTGVSLLEGGNCRTPAANAEPTPR